jgi:hypothetical protein
MNQEIIDDEDIAIIRERSEKFLCTLRVKLDVLCFSSERQRERDEGNIQRLVKTFSKGCHRLQPRNYIPAIINQQILEEVALSSGVSLQSLVKDNGDPPLLEFPSDIRVECLRGRSRRDAAIRLFLSEERWWVVDLYSEGGYMKVIRRIYVTINNEAPRYQ